MLRILSSLLLFALMTLPAHAHGNAGDGGFITGFNHPVLGFDHLLAMLSVGILSTQLGGKAIWRVPAAFVLFMAFGGMLGILSVSVPFVEAGIALSVLLLGLALVFDRALPQLLAMLFVGFFAIFHGHAHGTEMPSIANPIFYALGFLAGTIVIHLGGVVLGFGLQKLSAKRRMVRASGVGIAAIGGYLLMSVL